VTKSSFGRWSNYRSPMLTEKRDWFGSTIGLGGRRKFDGVLAKGWAGVGENPHFSQRTREMGHPAAREAP
jgi:hypothetical protein